MSPREASRQLVKIDALGAGACALLAGAAWFLGVQPALDLVGRQREQQQLVVDTLAEAQSQEGALLKAKSDLQAAQSELAKSSIELQPLEGMNQRLQALTQLAEVGGIAIDQMTRGDPKPAPRMTTVPIRLLGRAAFPSAARFIRSLREQFPDVAVLGVRFSGSAADPALGPAPASVELSLLWHAAGAARAGEASPNNAASAEKP